MKPVLCTEGVRGAFNGLKKVGETKGPTLSVQAT